MGEVNSIGVGLSPRGRGKPMWVSDYIDDKRSIPAWAGETSSAPSCNPNTKVYPRVGGGNASGPGPLSFKSGLSPRGRGKLSNSAHIVQHERSIPAWAGETGFYLVP